MVVPLPFDLGIDLGTANVLIYVKGKGLVLDEPACVAKDTRTGDVLAVGESARRMIGRTPTGIEVIRPVQAGVIADYDMTEFMLKYFYSFCCSCISSHENTYRCLCSIGDYSR